MPAAAKAHISYDPSDISLFRPPTVSARANGVTEKREQLRRFRVPCHHTYLLGKHAAPVSSSRRANPFRNPSPLHMLRSSKSPRHKTALRPRFLAPDALLRHIGIFAQPSALPRLLMRAARYALVASVVASVLVSAPVALRAQRTAAQPAAAQPARSIASQTAGMERHDGFIPFYYDEHTGKLLLEVQRLGQDFLYLPTLATGLGSNDLGLDRGTTGNEALVRFERFGPRVLLVSRNTRYRGTADSLQAHSVEESFATSTLAGMPIVAEEGGRLLVDATDFLLQDEMNVSSTIQRQK